MRKTILIILLLILTYINSFAATENTVITLACYPALDQGFKAILPDFYTEHPNIEVKIITKGYGDHHNDLVTSVSANENLPDVAEVDAGYLGQFISSGGMSNLIEEPFKANKYRHLMVPYQWVQATDEQDRLIAFPLEAAPGCAYWRRDRFSEASVNINQIKTMADLFTAAGKLTYDSDGDGKVDRWFTSDAANIAFMILRSSPERLYEIQKYRFFWNTPLMTEALTWAKRFNDAGYCKNVGAWTNEWYQSLADGSVAYEISGYWLAGHLKNWMAPKSSGLWSVSKWPALVEGEGRMKGSWGGSFLVIPTNAQNKKEAWDFVQYVCTKKESQTKMYRYANAFPANTSAWNDPYFNEPIEFLASQQARRLWIEISRSIPEKKTYKYDPIAETVLYSELLSVLHEGKNVENALADLKSQVYIDRKPRE